jgi:uncharacterized protein (TIGR02996 family)
VARNFELEAAVAANPDDEQGYLVYADWLQQQGDPLGELIVKHTRTTDDKAFLAEHQTDLLGPLADYEDMLTDRVWKHAFIRSVKVQNVFERSGMHSGKLEEFPVIELLAMLLDHECGRFLHELTIGIVDYEANNYVASMGVIAARELPALRTLFVGDFYSEETELNWSHLGDAGVMYKALPNLRSLTLRSGTMHLGAIDLPELRVLSTITGGLKKDAIESVTTARWPKLEKLSLQIGSPRYDSDIELADLQPILDGKGLPHTLAHLGLLNYENAEELIPLLAASKILPRITELDMSMGSLGADGATALIEHKRAFEHLRRIDLTRSWFDPETARRLKEILPNADVTGQRYNARYPEDRYIDGGE